MRRLQVVLIPLAAVASLVAAGAVTGGAGRSATMAASPAAAVAIAPSAGAGQADHPPGAAGLTAPAGVADGGTDDGTDNGTGQTTQPTGVPTEDIIPEPNSGRPPSEAGDRGGILQIAVLLAIVVAVGGIGAKVAHDARRARDRRASQAGR